ncbi:MAG: hypothetical protein IPH36_13480 [Saprospiraceae bacterium]|nr:hypothetical protein [Saprospiraceae bacterium]
MKFNKRSLVFVFAIFMGLQIGIEQKSKGVKTKEPNWEQIEKEVAEVKQLYESVADTYLSELKKRKEYDDMVAQWSKVIEEKQASKKSSMNKAFHDKYKDLIAAAISKCGINGPVLKGKLKKMLKSINFDIDRNTGTLLLHNKWNTAVNTIALGNCDVEHEWELGNGFDREMVFNDGDFFADGNTGAEDKKIFAAAEYGNYQMHRTGSIQVPNLDDVCNYRLYASGSYQTGMVYYANVCPVMAQVDTRILIFDDNDQLAYIISEQKIPLILPFQTTEDFIGSIEPVYNGNFVIDMNVNALQRYTFQYITSAATTRLCIHVSDIFDGYVHAYSEINFTEKLKLLYYTYSH